jgi:hypothetical protein
VKAVQPALPRIDDFDRAAAEIRRVPAAETFRKFFSESTQLSATCTENISNGEGNKAAIRPTWSVGGDQFEVCIRLAERRRPVRRWTLFQENCYVVDEVERHD